METILDGHIEEDGIYEGDEGIYGKNGRKSEIKSQLDTVLYRIDAVKTELAAYEKGSKEYEKLFHELYSLVGEKLELLDILNGKAPQYIDVDNLLVQIDRIEHDPDVQMFIANEYGKAAYGDVSYVPEEERNSAKEEEEKALTPEQKKMQKEFEESGISAQEVAAEFEKQAAEMASKLDGLFK